MIPSDNDESLVPAVMWTGVDSSTAPLDTDGSPDKDLYKNVDVKSTENAVESILVTRSSVIGLLMCPGMGGTAIKSKVVEMTPNVDW